MNWTEIWEFDYNTESRKSLLTQFYEKAQDVAKFRNIQLDGVANVGWRVSKKQIRVSGTVFLYDENELEDSK